MTLSFTWWGNDVRHEITEQLIAAFEAEHENITIEPQYTDWAGYWDKLATTVAAGDAPDIIQMDEKQLSTYAANGVLLDLGDLGAGLPTDDFPEAVLGTGALDGTQYGVPVGINTYTIMANPDLLESLGIELPDDETWSWDDFADYRRGGHRGQRRRGRRLAVVGLRGRRPEQLAPPARRVALRRGRIARGHRDRGDARRRGGSSSSR